MTEEVADRVMAHHRTLETSDVGGIGGTLAGNALSLAATRATLEEVLTDAAFDHMIGVAERFEAGVNEVIAAHGMPWHATRLGCRVEYHFRSSPPRNGSEAMAADDRDAQPLHAPARAQPRDPADTLPQDGADVPGDDRGRRRPAHGRLRGGGRGSGGSGRRLIAGDAGRPERRSVAAWRQSKREEARRAKLWPRDAWASDRAPALASARGVLAGRAATGALQDGAGHLGADLPLDHGNRLLPWADARPDPSGPEVGDHHRDAVPVVTWILMPRVTRLLRHWLYPVR